MNLQSISSLEEKPNWQYKCCKNVKQIALNTRIIYKSHVAQFKQHEKQKVMRIFIGNSEIWHQYGEAEKFIEANENLKS